MVKESQDFIAAIDSTGLCLFSKNVGLELEHYTDQIQAACGGSWDVERFTTTGERIWNMEKQFNLAAGLGHSDDTLPKRILEEPAPSGAAKGLVNRLDVMLPEYYKVRGWDENGVPTAATLGRLGLA